MMPRVKICGITGVADAMAAAEAGADYLGYIFYAPSKRFVAPRTAKEVVARVRMSFPDVQHVGVFVDETEETMAWIRALAGLDLLQLHGTESAEMCRALSLVGAEVIKATACCDADWTVNLAEYNVPYFLCDTHDPVSKGGSGRRFDLGQLPAGLDLAKTFIAGGLTPENIEEVLATARPFAFDVSSGVEKTPGVKDHGKIAEFISKVRHSVVAQ